MPVHPRRNDIVDIGTKRRRLEKLSERGVGHGFERPDLDLGGDRLLTGEIGRVEPALPPDADMLSDGLDLDGPQRLNQGCIAVEAVHGRGRGGRHDVAGVADQEMEPWFNRAGP